ncbi:deoxyribose-phosphate aldolase [Streptomyces triticiradicis]|uniref:Deoxyribose-phosphate aldolase n=1 Tax=Streptomyces triticiradicis TaxID=2651189 RepID=A0A7J5DHX7_9ACTN|nr:deoxyribose-phosphate aldolase [Streptomyces triticiradicis]KAB1988169.1 deoxyribose-phosphate aldolase [Streptomyces triticiradicis]
MSVASMDVPRWDGPLPSCDEVAKMIDHSLLRPELTAAEVEDGLATALEYRTASVCVRPPDVPRAAAVLSGSRVAVGTVVGFPHGSGTTAAKVFETAELISSGAEEIDMVINIGRLRDGDVASVQAEIAAVVRAAEGRPVKVIFENSYLTDQDKTAGYKAAEAAGAAFVKTSTGFAPGGATAADIALMRRTVSPRVQVKAAGGVRTLDALLELHRLGATRFGATATAAILDDLEGRRGGDPPAGGATGDPSTGY